jgi:hypothetical protein
MLNICTKCGYERYSGIHLMKVLLHIDELFTMGKLKPPLSSDSFAINRPSLSISRYMSRYKSDLALSAVFFIKFRGTNAIKIVTHISCWRKIHILFVKYLFDSNKMCMKLSLSSCLNSWLTTYLQFYFASTYVSS